MCALILIASVWLNPCEIAAMEMTRAPIYRVGENEWKDVCSVILRNGKTVEVDATCDNIASDIFRAG